jgi:hypothetical protein
VEIEKSMRRESHRKRVTIYWEGGLKECHLLGGSQASPPYLRISHEGSVKVKRVKRWEAVAVEKSGRHL